MPTPYPAETLLIEGADAIAFAQAQFSSKVSSLATGQWQFGAWLDPQGRVRAFFHLARLADDRLLLLLRGGSAATMADALRRFVFRSKLTLTALPSRSLTTGHARPMHAVDGNTETLLLGCGTYSMQVTTAAHDDSAWHLTQLREGWPWLPAQALNELLPPALSLHRLQAVAIDKGCYPGQEIVARLHYRGGNKRHLHHVFLSQAVSIGSVLRSDEHEIGRVIDAVNTDVGIEALAVLNDDVVAQSVNGRLNELHEHLVVQIDNTWPA
ncbi:folate-binding protein YgfZ [Rhodanobacter sp. C05]|nr:folate-binding protein YgfZ [Rhodanobacter sp. C05]